MSKSTKKYISNKYLDNFDLLQDKAKIIDFVMNEFTTQNYIEMITIHKIGDKLEYINSINTSPLINDLCIKRNMRKDLICSMCFSVRRLKFRKNNQPKYIRNTKILTSCIIPEHAIPFLNALYFRIESFGDLNNDIQAINYINLIKRNPLTNFAWWTKNPVFIKKAIEKGYAKPENVQIVFSVCKINGFCDVSAIKKAFPFVDKIFVVYTQEYIDLNNIEINCGGMHCINCLNCYKKGGNEIVREKLK